MGRLGRILSGTMPTNERLNRMAENAKRVVIEYRTSDDGSWQYLALATASPYVHELGCATPVGVEYRAHYISPSCAPGPLSEPVAAIIQAAVVQAVA